MLTHEQNDRLTRVGPGTPCGALLRRYWQAVCPTAELSGEGRKKRIRILGEDLVVFCADDGTFRCVSERCPHRSASLGFGFIEPDGIRCSYHGWKFDSNTGACIERPFEPQPPHEGIRIAAYPVEAYGGLLFVYMGPDPAQAPLVPHWDVLARNDRPKRIRMLPVHRCNWLQIQENTADSVHTYYLHGHALVQAGIDLPGRDYFYRPIVGYDWQTSEWGVEKTLEYGGAAPEVEIRPPLIFPNILRIPEGPVEALHFRIPVDDEHTRIIWMGLLPGKRDPAASADVPFVYENDPANYTLEDIDQTDFYGQDRIVWEAQGTIADRSIETLGASDRGIVLFRRMLAEQIERVERGEEPNVAMVRDPAANRCITFDASSNYPPSAARS